MNRYKRILVLFGIFSMLLMINVSIFAQPSANYYKKIDGLKKVELKLALKSIIANHDKITYGDDLAEAYETVYYQDDDKSYVYDMFSNDRYKFSSSVWNKEHVVANSWWGGVKNNAYSDIFSVIPSEKNANSRKSNYPLGEVKTVKWTNDCIKIGTAQNGQGGAYGTVFEPADEYKGDFARIYFYVATCYSDISWNKNSNSPSEIVKEDWPTLKPWLYEMLLRWHNADPVSAKEIQINNSAEKEQGNRNPFIDYPILADYIWGNYQNVAFQLDSAELYRHSDGSIIVPDPPVPPIDPDTITPVVPIDTTAVLIPGDIIFADYFDSVEQGKSTDTGSSSNAWAGDEYFLEKSVKNTWQAGQAVRLGSGKNVGTITSIPFEYAGGPVIVEISVKGWTTIEGKLRVTIGGESQEVAYTAKLSDNFETVTLIFYNVPENPTITIETTDKRCFVDDVVVKSATVQQPEVVEVLADSISIDFQIVDLEIGDTQQLMATVHPDDVTNNAVQWTTSDDLIAVVDTTGLVTAISSGVAIIYATTTDGTNLTAECRVEIRQAETFSDEDVNRDGYVNSLDVLNIYKFMQTSTGDEKGVIEDVNCDGFVNSLDVLKVYKYMQNH